MEKLNLHIHVYKYTYKYIHVHMLTRVRMYVLPRAHRQSRAGLGMGGSQPQPDTPPPPPTSGWGGNPQTSAAKVLNVRDTVTDLVAYLQAVSRLGSKYNVNAITVTAEAVKHQVFHCLRFRRAEKTLVFHHAQRVSKRDRKKHLAAPPASPPPAPLTLSLLGL